MRSFTHDERSLVMRIPTSTLLRRALLADACFSGVSGLAMAFDALALSQWTGLPAALVQGAGWFCIAYALFVGAMGTRTTLPRPLVWLVIVGNVGWALGSFELLIQTATTAIGTGVVISQAVVVLALAQAQFMGLRRSLSVRGSFASFRMTGPQ
jgi:glucose uptake protein GlcU